MFDKSPIFVFTITSYMSFFTIRFELEGGSRKDYILLEEQLVLFNIFKFIETEDGSTYILPQGEYRFNSENTLQHVLDQSILAAKEFRNKCKILVTESNGTAWTGLIKAS